MTAPSVSEVSSQITELLVSSSELSQSQKRQLRLLTNQLTGPVDGIVTPLEPMHEAIVQYMERDTSFCSDPSVECVIKGIR